MAPVMAQLSTESFRSSAVFAIVLLDFCGIFTTKIWAPKRQTIVLFVLLSDSRSRANRDITKIEQQRLPEQ